MYEIFINNLKKYEMYAIDDDFFRYKIIKSDLFLAQNKIMGEIFYQL
jgi:hypothetical protein